MRKMLMILCSLLLTVQLAHGQDAANSGVITAGQSVALQLSGHGSAVVTVPSSLWTGTLDFEVSLDGANWVAMPGIQLDGFITSGQNVTSTTTASGSFEFPVGGFKFFRVKKVGGTGSVTVSIRASAASTTVNTIPQGTTIVSTDGVTSFPVTTDGLTETQLRATPVPVSGTVTTGGLTNTELRATPVPVSASSLPLPSGAATEATLSSLNGKVTAVNTGAVVVSSSALPTGASTSANQTNGTQQTQIVDGGVTVVAPFASYGGSPKAMMVGGYYNNGNLYPLPVMPNNFVLPGSSDPAVSITNRDAVETSGSAQRRSTFTPVGGISNGLTSSEKFVLGNGDSLSVVPASTFGLQVRELGQSFVSSGNISVVGNRFSVSSRFIRWSSAVFGLSSSSFLGTVKPVVSLDNGSTWRYVTAVNAQTLEQVTQLVDSAADGAFVIPMAAGATNYGFEVTARASGSINTTVSANTGSNTFLAAGDWLTNTQLRASAVPVDGSGATQPISAAALPLPSGAATSANQTNGTQQSKITDGVNTAAVQDIVPDGTEQALVVRTIAGSGVQEVVGDVRIFNGSNLADVSAAGALKVDGSASAQPVTDNGGSLTVDGTVAATQSGNWSVRAQDGAGNTLTSSTSDPAGSERGLIVRNIPSGTQQVSGTVTVSTRGFARTEEILASVGPFTSLAINPRQDGLATMVLEWLSGVCASCEVDVMAIDEGGQVHTLTGMNVETLVKTQTITNPGGVWVFDVAGFESVGVYLEEYTSGSADVAMSASESPSSMFASQGEVQGLTATNTAKSGNPVQVGGVFNTTQPTVTTGKIVEAQSTARGAQIVAPGVEGFAVTASQATAANFNAQVQGAAASGASKAGNPVQVGGVFNTTQPTVTNGQAVEVQSTARGAQIVATGADTFNVTVNAALPTGSNTIGALTANQSVNTAQVNGATVNVGTGAASTGTQRVTTSTDSTIGTVTAVTAITNALPAGTNAIGKLAANSGVDIGDVDVTSLVSTFANAKVDASGSTVKIDQTTTANDVDVVSEVPGTGATNLGKAEDAVHNTGDTGVAMWAVRNDSTATTFGGNGDYSPIAVDAQGAVFTRPSTRRLVSIAGQDTIAAPTADTWYIRRQWALPSGAFFTPSHAWAAVTTALTKTLFVIANDLGNLNVGTNTFTANHSVASPQFYGRLFGCVTTVLSATPDTVTPTYTDELGNSQALSAGVVFAASTPVGNCFEFPLNAATPASALDSGVRAVTAAVDTAATTGVITFYGVNVLADFAGTAANQTETQQFPPATSPELEPNEQIIVLMRQAATTAQLKTFGISGTLR